MGSLMKFSDVKAKHADPSTLRDIIETVLTTDDDACASEMEKYMTVGGVMGSREYDHAMAVNTLLEHDKKLGGHIASALVASNWRPRMLWDQLVLVYRKAGFIMKNGRITGIKELEDKSAEDNGVEDGIE